MVSIQMVLLSVFYIVAASRQAVPAPKDRPLTAKLFASHPDGFVCQLLIANNRRLYFDRATEVCRKWGIPYIDLWNTCYLNPMLPWMFDKTKTKEEIIEENICFYVDGQHLSSRGYDVTADIINSWLMTL